SLHALIFWRFVQGLVLPPIFTVVVAYIGEEWPASQATGVTDIYRSATSIGGFCGRFFSGVLADTIGWRSGFLTLAAVTLACGIAVSAGKRDRREREKAAAPADRVGEHAGKEAAAKSADAGRRPVDVGDAGCLRCRPFLA